MRNDHVTDPGHFGKTAFLHWLSTSGPLARPKAPSINRRLVAPVLAKGLIASAAPPSRPDGAVATQQSSEPTLGSAGTNLSEATDVRTENAAARNSSQTTPGSSTRGTPERQSRPTPASGDPATNAPRVWECCRNGQPKALRG